MEILKTSAELSGWRQRQNAAGKSVGFVPTMGALHSGHISLVRRAMQENDCCLVSIFVNPLQFNNGNDLVNYPRKPEEDLALLQSVNCHAVYMPDYHEVFGTAVAQSWDLGPLEFQLEGAFRPGHFQGVANVIFCLFSQINPHKAYFGLKDYQQYLIIHQFAKRYFPETEVIGCPTCRDPAGLAESSRNLRLSPEEYAQAIEIPTFLLKIPERMHHVSFSEISIELQKIANQLPLIRLEYFSLHRADNLEKLQHFDFNIPMIICIAFYAGEVRLIDNILC